MRDFIVTAIIFGSLPFILRSARVGLLVWVWISVMNPHRLTWGFAWQFNFAAVVAAVTLVSIVFSREMKRPPRDAIVVLLVMFVLWICVTTAFAIHPADAFINWKTIMKTQLMVLLIPLLFHEKEDLRKLVWVIVVSIAYFGTKGGLFTLMTGGGERVWGPPGSYIEDNNALAVATVMVIPLMRYLQATSPHKYVKWMLTGMMLLCGVSVLGSYSRGALLASGIMIVFLCWKSGRKLPVLLAALIAVPLVLSYLPQKWYNRMETIADYQDDDSANMRFNSWGTMWNIAKSRPLTGAGPEVAMRDIYDRYAPDPHYPPQAAHSIYFQSLGEHGFVGLALYLGLLLATWRKAGRVIAASGKRPDLVWARELAAMIQVSFIGFMVGGAFLSLVNWDVPYFIMAIVVAMYAIVERETKPSAQRDSRAPYVRGRPRPVAWAGAARPIEAARREMP